MFLQRLFLSRLSLRANLLLLLGLAAAFLILDRTTEIVDNRKSDIARAGGEILDVTRRIAQRQADVIADARAILRLAAGLPESDGSSMTACQVPFRHIVDDLPWLRTISVVAPDGNVVCSSSGRMAALNLADRAYFQEALTSRGFVLSDYTISRLAREPVIVAAMPRITGEMVESVLIASIDVDWLGRLAADHGGRSDAEFLLADSNGTIIAAYPLPERWVGKSLTGQPDVWSRLKGADGVFESDGFDGRPRIVAHAALPDTKAVLAVTQARGDVLGPANRQARFALAKIGLTGFFCLLVVWLGGEHLVLRPIADLTRNAAGLGSGNLTARVRTEGLSAELGLLGHTFNNMAAQLAQHEAEVQRTNIQLKELATTDGLTGLANRRRFDEQIEHEWERAIRARMPISLLIVDVDNFKQFNDRYGHIEGDGCLQRVAGILKGAARRTGDLASRTGGEEFAMLLPGADVAAAAKIADAIRADIAALGIEHFDSSEGRVTVSIGAAALKPTRSQKPRLLLDAADAALYRAKRGGRNRVVLDRMAMPLAS